MKMTNEMNYFAWILRSKWFTSWVTFAPNNQPAPLGLIDHVSTSSGSDHTKCSTN